MRTAKNTKPTPAFWRETFMTLSREEEPKIRPGVEAEIEADMSGKGGNAFARRAGLAYLTQPFRESARRMGNDRESAEIMLDLANRVQASAEAHREVARLLDMAQVRIFAALSGVAAKVDRVQRRKVAA